MFKGGGTCLDVDTIENFVYLTVYIRCLGGKKVVGGKTKMSQITYGLQLGGQVYSQMIFFRDERVLMISPPVSSSLALRRVPNLASLLGEVDQFNGSP